MASNSKDPDPVEIHIRSTADTAGIEKTTEAIEQTTDATRKLGTEEAAREGRGFGGQLDVTASQEAAEAKRQEAAAREEVAEAARAEAEALEETARAAEKEREERQRADVERAKAMKRQREDVAAVNEEVARLRRAEQWRAVGQELKVLTAAVTEFAGEFAKTEQGKEMLAGLSEELKIVGSTATSVASSAAAGFAVGGPWGGAIGGLTGLVKSLGGEFLSTNARIAQSEAELQAATVAHTLRLQERREEATNDAIRKAYESERKELEGQREQLEQIAALRDAKGDLAAAEDKLQDAKALNAGVPREAIAIGNVGEQLTADRAKLAADLQTNRDELQILANELFAASNTYKAQVDAVGREKAEAGDAFAEMNRLLDQVGSAESNLAALQERLNVQEQAFTTGAQAELEEQKGRLLGTLSGQAEKLRSDLDAEIQEKGNSASLTAKSALADLTKILGDRAVTESEVQQLVQIMERLRTTQEGKDAAVLDGIAKIATNGDTFLGILQRTVNEVGKHAERLRNLDSQMQGIEMRSGMAPIAR